MEIKNKEQKIYRARSVAGVLVGGASYYGLQKYGFKPWNRISGKYIFKNGAKNTNEKIDNLVYVNYVKLTSSNKDDFIKNLKDSGVLDIEYDSIIIEKGYYKNLIEEIKNIFKQKENCIIIESPYYFSEKILLVIDAIINQKRIEIGEELEYEE
jgi:hypothetical protein